MVSEKNFEYFFENLPFMLPRKPFQLIDLDKSGMKLDGLLYNHFRNKNQISQMAQQKLSISTFPIIKSMETISCHSNQSSYPTGIKT